VLLVYSISVYEIWSAYIPPNPNLGSGSQNINDGHVIITTSSLPYSIILSIVGLLAIVNLLQNLKYLDLPVPKLERGLEPVHTAIDTSVLQLYTLTLDLPLPNLYILS